MFAGTKLFNRTPMDNQDTFQLMADFCNNVFVYQAVHLHHQCTYTNGAVVEHFGGRQEKTMPSGDPTYRCFRATQSFA